MRLQMGRVDHDALGPWPLAGKRGEDAVEDAELAPADEAIVERLVWPVTLGCVFPLEAVAHGERPNRKTRNFPAKTLDCLIKFCPFIRTSLIIHRRISPQCCGSKKEKFPTLYGIEPSSRDRPKLRVAK